jgi:hypothetical protein
MKKALFILIIIAALTSCAVGPDARELKEVIYTRDRTDLEGPITDALYWIRENIMYVSDLEHFGVEDYWAPKSVTLRDKQGDCEDQSNLLILMVYEETGLKGKLAIFYCPDLNKWHACAYIDGIFYDPRFAVYSSAVSREMIFSHFVSFETIELWTNF